MKTHCPFCNRKLTKLAKKGTRFQSKCYKCKNNYSYAEYGIHVVSETYSNNDYFVQATEYMDIGIYPKFIISIEFDDSNIDRIEFTSKCPIFKSIEDIQNFQLIK